MGRENRVKQILYTGNNQTGLNPYNFINFSYQIKEDANTSYEAGASIVSNSVIKSISIIHTNDQGVLQPVRKYVLNYVFDNVQTKLTEITEYAGDETSPSLNSTAFTYGTVSQNDFTRATDGLNGPNDIISGDFDGDGKTEVATIDKSYNSNLGTFLNTRYTLYKNIVVFPNYGLTFMYAKNLPQGTSINNVKNASFYNFMAADFNGDGRDDILQVNTFTNQYTACNPTNGSAAYTAYRRNINGVTINYTKSFNPNTGFTEYAEGNFSFPTSNFVEYKFIHESGNFIFPGDFNGDGNQDYILITGKRRQIGWCSYPGVPGSFANYAYDYKAFFTSPSTNIINVEIGNFGVGTNNYGADFYAGSVAIADKISVLDFDGDGKMELLITKEQQTYVLAVQPVSISTGFSFVGVALYNTGAITKDSKYYTGDFNGDKKTDFLVRINNTSGWNILYSTGKIFNTVGFNFNQNVYLTVSGTGDKISIGDYNGDGKSDVLHGYSVWINGVANTSKLSIYYSLGGATTASFIYEQNDYPKLLSFVDLVQGDFNGDGRSDLISLIATGTPSGIADFIFIKPYSQEKLLKNITTGHNVETNFDYKLLTDKTSYPYFYDRTISLDDPQNKNPFNYVQLPLYAAHKIIAEDGVGGTNVTEFAYENAVVHRAAKGFLGFEKITSKNNITGITTVSENGINRLFAVPFALKETKKLTSSNYTIAETIFSISFLNLSLGYVNKSFLTHVDETTSFDYLNDKATNTSNTFDVFNNVTSTTNKVGYKNGMNIVPVEINTTETTFGLNNTNVPAKPINITSINTRVGYPSVSLSQIFTYDNLGRLLTQIDFAGLPKAHTVSYSYNSLGNILTTTKAAAGLIPQVSINTYDTKGRFIIQKQVNGGSLSQTESSLIDTRWGVPISNTTPDCLTTTYEYDSFGKLIKTNLPDGNNVVITKTWQINGAKLFFVTEHSSGGSPDRKKYFDKWGKEWKDEKASMEGSNKWHTILTTYDSKGNVYSKTNSPFPGIETPRITTNDFDVYNRSIYTSDYKGITAFNYTNLGLGRIKVSITGTDGQIVSQTTDASGKIISSTDNGGNLSFEYNSRGNQTSTNINGTNVSSSTYDVYGIETSTTDVDAGTTIYNYDNFNRLIGQTDAKGNNYVMTYDGLGRIATRAGSEGTTSFEYYTEPTNSCSSNKVKKEIGFNGIIREYTYDELKRLQAVTETGVDAQTRVTSFTYNAFAAVSSITYPSGVSIINSYDLNGYLIRKNVTSSSGVGFTRQIPIFYNPQIDGEGKYVAYTLTNGKTTTKTYYNDFPTSTNTPSVQNLTYSFQPNTGNLMQRNDVLRGQVENFSYDNLNRLTNAVVNNVTQNAVSYDGGANSSIGNINTKTDAGYYTYQTTKKHAVAYITAVPTFGQSPTTPEPVSVISNNEQNITYTPFQKVQSVFESSLYSGSPSLEFVYGPDYDRVTSTYCFGRSPAQIRYFAGDYEEQSQGTSARSIHYVNVGDGICAMIVKENNTLNAYAVYTDYLGSILTVTNRAGEIIASQNFDAWGRFRNPNNWNQFVAYQENPVWLYRGFTGHEMLPAFDLINMNGRMYDPVMGRMISPDNYVSNPSGTQGYNRYSYAGNNPLVYTDPDGNLPVLAIVGIFAGVHLGADLIRNDFKMSLEKILISTFKGAVNGVMAVAGPASISTATGALVAAAASELPGLNMPLEGGFSLNISPAIAFGGNDWSFGGLVNLQYSNENFDFGIGMGLGYGTNAATGVKGFTGVKSTMAGLKFGDVSLGLGQSTFKGGGTNQSVGMAYAGIGDFRVRYENDYMWKGAPVGDGNDRFRTTAATISYKDYSVGLNLFTGEPTKGKDDKSVQDDNQKTGFKGTYNERQYFRSSPIYIGVGNYRFGATGEPIRKLFQNHLAHNDGYRYPLFKVMNNTLKPYAAYHTRNMFTSW